MLHEIYKRQSHEVKMGDIRVRFTATRRGKKLRGAALVDSGAATTMFGLHDACRLGLNLEKAPKVDRETAGGLLLTGLRLTGVHVEANGRKAVLEDVFVPIAQVVKVRDKTGKINTKTKAVVRDQEPLLGQDFLQASGSFLDFATDSLRGVESLGPPIRLTRKFHVRPASRRSLELIRALASCPTKERRRK